MPAAAAAGLCRHAAQAHAERHHERGGSGRREERADDARSPAGLLAQGQAVGQSSRCRPPDGHPCIQAKEGKMDRRLVVAAPDTPDLLEAAASPRKVVPRLASSLPEGMVQRTTPCQACTARLPAKMPQRWRTRDLHHNAAQSSMGGRGDSAVSPQKVFCASNRCMACLQTAGGRASSRPRENRSTGTQFGGRPQQTEIAEQTRQRRRHSERRGAATDIIRCGYGSSLRRQLWVCRATSCRASSSREKHHHVSRKATFDTGDQTDTDSWVESERERGVL